ncbi:hypothetical protein ABZ912_23905 [Nonomuraea angiospora]|uniref:hypothetical protein n=1 Tax=Nonomuraea angiospora TaxID=46172 RepID=UPI0033CD88C0
MGPQLRRAWDRLAVRDPGLMRSTTALAAVAGIALALAVLAFLDVPAPFLVAGCFAPFTAALAIGDRSARAAGPPTATPWSSPRTWAGRGRRGAPRRELVRHQGLGGVCPARREPGGRSMNHRSKTPPSPRRAPYGACAATGRAFS